MEHGAVSLQQAIVRCGWLIEVLGGSYDDVANAVAALLSAPECFIQRERKGKTTVTDVRPAVLELEVVQPTESGVQLRAVLATDELTLRPSELITVLSSVLTADPRVELREGRVRRTHQWTSVDGVDAEPIESSSPTRATELAGMRDS